MVFYGLSPGKHMKLSPEAEEVATFFAKMLDHEYTTKDIFRKNFFKDWRKVMLPWCHPPLSFFKMCETFFINLA